MAGQASNYQREVRDTIVKSGLTGVAAAALAVTFISPAGFGGMIGETLASGFGFDSNASALLTIPMQIFLRILRRSRKQS